jgi:hypothetical protein
VAFVAALLTAAVAIAGGAVSESVMAKVGAELQALHDAYLIAQKMGTPLTSPSPWIQLVDGRVVIDAVAAGDVADLRADLLALGMQHVASAGRIVSGQLPIPAIPAMAALPSLRFARAATMRTQERR